VGQRQDKTTLAKPNAIMFFHIPLAQSYGPVDEDPVTGLALDVGTQLPGDGQGNSQTDSGMFDELLETFEVDEEETGQGVGVKVPEVKVIGHGHSHSKSWDWDVNGKEVADVVYRSRRYRQVQEKPWGLGMFRWWG